MKKEQKNKIVSKSDIFSNDIQIQIIATEFKALKRKLKVMDIFYSLIFITSVLILVLLLLIKLQPNKPTNDNDIFKREFAKEFQKLIDNYKNESEIIILIKKNNQKIYNELNSNYKKLFEKNDLIIKELIQTNVDKLNLKIEKNKDENLKITNLITKNKATIKKNDLNGKELINKFYNDLNLKIKNNKNESSKNAILLLDDFNKTELSKLKMKIEKNQNNISTIKFSIIKINNSIKKNEDQIDFTSNIANKLFGLWNKSELIFNRKGIIIFEDIQKAYDKKIFQKIGSPDGFATNNPLWKLKSIISIGKPSTNNKSGILVNIPNGGYDNLGVRILNDRFICFSCIYSDDYESIGIFCGGYTNNGNSISPDGSVSGSYNKHNKWIYIPVKKAKSIIISNSNYSERKFYGKGWISGLSFGKNDLWSFTINSAYAFVNAVNGGNQSTYHSIWNNDQLSFLEKGKNYTIYVPIIPNGKDKILFFTGYGNYVEGNCITEIMVNDKNVERT